MVVPLSELVNYERCALEWASLIFCFCHVRFDVLVKRSRGGNVVAREVRGDVYTCLPPPCKWSLKPPSERDCWKRIYRLENEKSQHFRRWTEMEELSPTVTTHINIALRKHLCVLTFIPHWLCTRHGSRHLANVNSFIPHNHPMT